MIRYPVAVCVGYVVVSQDGVVLADGPCSSFFLVALEADVITLISFWNADASLQVFSISICVNMLVVPV
jgi:hypothetical protein